MGKGRELGASGKITDNWDVFGGIVCMDSERRHSTYLDYVSSANWQGRRGLLGDPRTFTLSTHFHF